MLCRSPSKYPVSRRIALVGTGFPLESALKTDSQQNTTSGGSYYQVYERQYLAFLDRAARLLDHFQESVEHRIFPFWNDSVSGWDNRDDRTARTIVSDCSILSSLANSARLDTMYPGILILTICVAPEIKLVSNLHITWWSASSSSILTSVAPV